MRMLKKYFNGNLQSKALNHFYKGKFIKKVLFLSNLDCVLLPESQDTFFG